MAIQAMIFDFDGTLIDSNNAHTDAWAAALTRCGYRVGRERIFSEIGKGGDTFVPDLLGRDVDEADGERLREAQPEEFARIATASGLKVFPGTRELLTEVRRRGIKTAVATSGNRKQLAVNEKCSGLVIEDYVDIVVDSDAAERSKPHPDLVAAAVKKLKVSPAQCAMVGDTPHDAEACRRAGVVCLGVMCGGHGEEELRRAGARAVWRDPADLLRHLDEAMRIASPSPVAVTDIILEGLMRQALEQAERAIGAGEAPIGAVLARGDGTVIAAAHNLQNKSGDRTAHAEMVAFREAAVSPHRDAADLFLISTLEPCVMCLGAAMQMGVDTAVYGLAAPADGGARRVMPPVSPGSSMPRVVGNVLVKQSRRLFEKWLEYGDTSNRQQVAYVKQLLAMAKNG